MAAAEGMDITFPDIRAYWRMGLGMNLILPAFWLVYLLVLLAGGREAINGPWYPVSLAAVYAGGLVLHSLLSSRQKKLVPAINERFAAEFMLRTGHPPYPEDIDVLSVRRTIAVRTGDGAVRLWSVKRRRDVFTIEPV